MRLLAQGTDFDDLGDFEHLIPEGAQVRFVARLSEPLLQEDLDRILDEIESHGVTALSVAQTAGRNPDLAIDCEKHMGPLLIVGLVLAGLIALPVMVFSWRLFLIDPRTLIWTVMGPLVLIGMAGVAVIALVARPQTKKAGKLAWEGTKRAAPYAAKAIMKA